MNFLVGTCHIQRAVFVDIMTGSQTGPPAEFKEHVMPQYFLAVNHDAADTAAMAEMTIEQMQPIFEAVDTFNNKLQAEGAWVFAGGLTASESATTVDNTGEKPIITDGPYAESKEYLGGFWIIEAADLDAALDWAKQGSKACQGRVEVRPFQEG